ncbi:MAG TPA: DNA-binding domain-containing protein [Azospirillaceae bacterium]|nr:DNA-binding domain-containing protein [Azospirillaceae bacterium]
MPRDFPRLRGFQEDLRAAVLGGDPGPVLRRLEGPVPATRLAVLRSNVLGSLAGALADAFPVTERLLGAAVFRPLALAYAAASPPEAPQLLAYGGGFPDHLEECPGLPPGAGSLARLEWARNGAYFAADATPLPLERVRAVPPDLHAGIRFLLHPSARLLATGHRALAVLEAAAAGDPPAPPEPGPERLLVVRPGLDVLYRRLSPGAFGFLLAVGAGMTLGEAAAAAHLSEPAMDLTAVLAGHLALGTFCGLSVD